MEHGPRICTRERRDEYVPTRRPAVAQRFHRRFPGTSVCLLLALAASAAGCGELQGAAAQDASTGSPHAEDARDAAAQHDDARHTRGRPNRLARESSPYLLLHAHNPVDWYPWGPEAFERARREGKPIFLSIGYTSCHWCHVMERLVFENAAIAAYMNEHFVNVKVDREERPDVDEIYMTALQVYYQLAGSRQSGGWPLSMFLTPDGKPIAGGTYFPPETKDGRVGFPDVMRKMVDVWSKHRQGVEGNAELISREVRRLMQPQLNLKPRPLEASLVEAAVAAIADSYDPEYGGVGFDPAHPHSPKFPTPPKLMLLQHAAAGDEGEQAGKIVRHTLDAIAAGGIRDHLGGGFHRYSTDREWLVPHFEKMLYDQAQLARLYVEAFARTGERRDREVAESTLDFVLRELTDPEGGFHSALDAETEGVEGKYYVWSREEVERILGLDDARLFMQAYGMNDESPFEHGYVLHRPQPLDRLAADLRLDRAELERGLAEMRVKLLAARQERPPLLRDDKVLTSWNGLMIGTLARAGDVLDRPDYLAAAERAAVFVLSNMRNDQKRLQRTWRGGRASLNAYLDDYAFLIQGLLDLHDAAAEDPRADASRWLNAAVRLTDQQIELFWDETGKAFYFTSHDHEELLARTKNAYSSVIPSGNGVAAQNLQRIAALTGQEKYRVHARQTLETFVGELENSPGGLADFTLALAELLEEPGARDASQQRPDPNPAAEPTENSSAADPSTEDATGILQAAGESPKPREGDPEIVTAKAFLDVDRLPIGGTARIVVFLEIAEGWHINTNPAQPENLIPTKFTIQSQAGTELSDVKYPAGKKLEIEGIDEPVLVYENRAILRGTLTVPREANADADEIELRIRYQPCNDRQCLSPRTLKLNGRVPLARDGEPVKAINQNLFPKPGEEGRAAPRARGGERGE